MVKKQYKVENWFLNKGEAKEEMGQRNARSRTVKWSMKTYRTNRGPIFRLVKRKS